MPRMVTPLFVGAQKSAVNLLSSVLDTPEFFWHAPDAQQTLYNRWAMVLWGDGVGEGWRWMGASAGMEQDSSKQSLLYPVTYKLRCT